MDQPTSPAATSSLDQPPLGFVEFVGLVAGLLALTALGIDSMLPALPAIGDSLGVTAANDRQFIITAFLIGFAVSQLAYGPLADRYGRKPVLGTALLAYVACNLLAAISGSFELLLVARVAGGAAAGGARVITVALVRDCYSGRAMARVMSLSFIVFLSAPVLAPTFGQMILLVGSWRWIFGGIALVSAMIGLWFWLRMPETLHAADRQPIEFQRLRHACWTVLSDRCALGYTLATAALTGALFGFIGSVQQVMFDVFKRPELLTVVFAAVAGTMAVGSLINARLVMRLGTRRISHTALVALILLSAVHLAVTLAGLETLWTFAILQALMMASFGLATSNFSAMAMENMGAIAGTASSVQGFVSTLVGALLGALIGQLFDGSTVPLYLGFLVLGLVALVAVFVTERGRMFRPT
jgi:DHA1 family bicyclomycin/chloramphenicol resistance-like MFS transporter